jgi:uncharacterized integral membrane protein (TIGR00697 family)
MRFFKKEGLLVYIVIAVIVCNMQVLKAADFTFYSDPVALGTIVYASSFLASDAITEFYSVSYARKSVAISFVASIAVLIMMIIALGHKDIIINNPSDLYFKQNHDALRAIFTPNVAILTASLIAYGTSQLVDIHIFSRLKKISTNKLWMRTFFSLAVSSLFDTVIFNFLAWKVFSPHYVSWHSLIFNYMIGGYILLLIVSFCNIPAMYLLSKIAKK